MHHHASEKSACVACYHQVLVGRDYIGRHATATTADARSVLAVRRFVQLKPQPAASLADRGANRHSVFTDTRSEDDPVRPSESRG